MVILKTPPRFYCAVIDFHLHKINKQLTLDNARLARAMGAGNGRFRGASPTTVDVCE